MMNRFGVGVLVGALSMSVIACGKSPLLNHAAAGMTGPAPLFGAADDRTEQERSQCPLQFKAAALCASIAWDKSPTSDDEGSFTLKFWRASDASPTGPYTDPASTVAVKLWMPDMGHGSSPVHVAHAKDASGADETGVFSATNVYFIMPGEWEIHIQLKNGNSVVDEAVEKVTI